MTSDLGLVAVGTAALATAALVAWWWTSRKFGPGDAGFGRLEPGPVEVTGPARPAGKGLVEAPFTAERCLLAKWWVEEYDPTVDGYATVAQGVEAVPFQLQDRSGRVVVDPDGARVEPGPPADPTEASPPGDPPSEAVAEFLAGADEPRSSANRPPATSRSVDEDTDQDGDADRKGDSDRDGGTGGNAGSVGEADRDELSSLPPPDVLEARVRRGARSGTASDERPDPDPGADRRYKQVLLRPGGGVRVDGVAESMGDLDPRLRIASDPVDGRTARIEVLEARGNGGTGGLLGGVVAVALVLSAAGGRFSGESVRR